MVRYDGARLAATLRTMRESKGLSQEQVAERSGVSVRAISNLEAGRTERPRLTTLSLLVAVLDADADVGALLAAAGAGERTGSGGQRSGPVGPRPRQLPLAGGPFAGRAAELDRLRELPGGAVVVVSGLPGVGKTTLAVRLGRELADRFPDGELFLQLHGAHRVAGHAMPAVDGLGRLLRALGVDPAAVPSDEDEASALFRTATAGRRLLLVLDDAASPAQVRPLLPAGADSLTVITSRHRLDSLTVAHGAEQLFLDVLAPDSALALLSDVIGPDRVAAEPDQAAALTDLCGHLPLALRIAAAKLAARPGQPIAAAVERLAGAGRIPELTAADGDHGVRRAFDETHRLLDPEPRELFRRIGTAPVVDVSAATVAAMQGTSGPAAREALDRLVSGHLLRETGPDRYQMHDLLRAYAAEQPAPAGSDAVTRLLDHYRRTARAASEALGPQLLRLPWPDDPPPRLDEATALRWLEDERANLRAVLARAAELGRPDVAWSLADSLRALFLYRKYHHDWAVAVEYGRAAARQQRDVAAEAAMVLSRATLDWGRSALTAAQDGFRQAAGLCRQAGWREGEAAALSNAGGIARLLGDLDGAAAAYGDALERHRAAGSARGEAMVRANLATLAIDRGDLDAAVEHATAAHAAFVATGSTQAQARQLLTLGTAYLRLGRPPDADGALRRALELHRSLGVRDAEADCLDKLARLAVRTGDLAGARDLLDEAVRICREIDDPATEVDALVTRATLQRLEGRAAAARETVEAALATARRVAYRGGEVEARTLLARVLADLGDRPAAAAAADRAVELARSGGYRLLEAEVSAVRAGLGPVADD